MRRKKTNNRNTDSSKVVLGLLDCFSEVISVHFYCFAHLE
jgi:hypothetical protein